MNFITYEISTIYTLWARDLKGFFRSPLGLLWSLVVSLCLWLILSSVQPIVLTGISALLLVMYLVAVVMGALIIQDKREGFLQVVMAAPGSKVALVLGKCLAMVTFGLFFGAFFLALLPFSGVDFSQYFKLPEWGMLLGLLAASSFIVSAISFSLGWSVNSLKKYYALQILWFLPLWLLSGGMLENLAEHDLLNFLQRFNPLYWSFTGLQALLVDLPAETMPNMWLTGGVLGSCMLFSALLATLVAYKN